MWLLICFLRPLWHHTTKSSTISTKTWFLTKNPVSSFSRCGAKVNKSKRIKSKLTQNHGQKVKSTRNRCNEQADQYFVENEPLKTIHWKWKIWKIPKKNKDFKIQVFADFDHPGVSKNLRIRDKKFGRKKIFIVKFWPKTTGVEFPNNPWKCVFYLNTAI